MTRVRVPTLTLTAFPLRRWWEVRRLEKPAYAVLRKLSDRSEVRAYAPVRGPFRHTHTYALLFLVRHAADPSCHVTTQYIIAEAEIPDAESGGSMRKSMNSGFRSVAGFIFGGNERRESVAMTSPVRTERVEAHPSEKIAMTSPVRTERVEGGGAGGAFRVSFVMPRKYKLDTLPTPRDTRVHLREVSPSRFVPPL